MLKWFLHSKGHKELEMISALNAYEVLVHIELFNYVSLILGKLSKKTCKGPCKEN